MRKPERNETTRKEALAGLSIRRDDFAVMAQLEGDPMFWIRIEPGEPETLRLTDLMPGAQPPEFVADALRLLLVEAERVRRVVLLDILPDWRNHPTRAVELERRMSATRAILEAAFRPFDLAVSDVGLSERRDKLDLVVTLAAQDA